MFHVDEFAPEKVGYLKLLNSLSNRKGCTCQLEDGKLFLESISGKVSEGKARTKWEWYRKKSNR